MAARRPFWKWHRWKSIGFCLWPPSTCIWNLKLKFQSKLDLCSGNHVVYRQTDGRTDWQTDRRTDKVNPVYPPSNFVGRGYNKNVIIKQGAKVYQNILCQIEKSVLRRRAALLQRWGLNWIKWKHPAGVLGTADLLQWEPIAMHSTTIGSNYSIPMKHQLKLLLHFRTGWLVHFNIKIAVPFIQFPLIRPSYLNDKNSYASKMASLYLTHWGLVTPSGNIDLGQHRFR